MMQEHHSEHHEHKPEHHAEHGHGGMPEIPKVDMKNVNADALKGGFGDVLEILKLNKAAIEKVAHRDGEGINIALVYLVVASLVSSLGGPIIGYAGFRVSILNALLSGVIAAVVSAVIIYVTNLAAEKLFQGKGTFPQYFRVMGYASLVNLLGFIMPLLPFGLISLFALLLLGWGVAVNYVTLTTVHKLNSTNAILTIIVQVVAYFVLGAVVASLGLTAAGYGAGLAISR